MVKIGDIVAPISEPAAGAMPANVSSVQVTGDIGSQRSTGVADARLEEKEEVAKVAPGLGGPVVSSAANSATVAVSIQAGNNGMAMVEEMVEKLKAENLALNAPLIAEMLEHARALLDNVRF